MLDELRDDNVHANLGLACVASLLDRLHEQVEHLCGPAHNLLERGSASGQSIRPGGGVVVDGPSHLGHLLSLRARRSTAHSKAL